MIFHGRMAFIAHIAIQDLVDSYMPAFDDCVQKGNVSGLMCSYNAVNGKPSCANDWLLTEVARDNWGFDGYKLQSKCPIFPIFLLKMQKEWKFSPEK